MCFCLDFVSQGLHLFKVIIGNFIWNCVKFKVTLRKWRWLTKGLSNSVDPFNITFCDASSLRKLVGSPVTTLLWLYFVMQYALQVGHSVSWPFHYGLIRWTESMPFCFLSISGNNEYFVWSTVTKTILLEQHRYSYLEFSSYCMSLPGH